MDPQHTSAVRCWRLAGHILGWRHHGLVEGGPVSVDADNVASIEFEMTGNVPVLMMLPLVEVTFLPANVLRSAELGLRVRRGLDWDWGDQDGGPNGSLGLTVEGEGQVDVGWVNVRWDHGEGNSYRVGANGKYDLMVVTDWTRRALLTGNCRMSGCPRSAHCAPQNCDFPIYV